MSCLAALAIVISCAPSTNDTYRYGGDLHRTYLVPWRYHSIALNSWCFLGAVLSSYLTPRYRELATPLLRGLGFCQTSYEGSYCLAIRKGCLAIRMSIPPHMAPLPM